MSTSFQETAKVVSQKQLAKDIMELVVQTEQIAMHAKPGQFVSLYCDDAGKLLPRPISICGIDRGKNRLRFVYRVTGEHTGTAEFASKKEGDAIKVLGPLGNGFSLDKKYKKVVLLGGGIGVPPMLALAKEAKLLYKDTPTTVSAVMGYRDSATFLSEEFRAVTDTYIATEDGSIGTKGNVLDAMREYALEADVLYACGPHPMLRAVKQFATEHDMDCFISMEERMACGIGACLACVCKTTQKDAHSNVHNKRICKDGPVFDAREVEL
jgi:dihydroorotate dehydrogenase electron transfer subunit